MRMGAPPPRKSPVTLCLTLTMRTSVTQPTSGTARYYLEYLPNKHLLSSEYVEDSNLWVVVAIMRIVCMETIMEDT